MRPSNEAGIVMVLDTEPECKVIFDALELPENHLPDNVIGDEATNSINIRFDQQAMGMILPELKYHPEFRVEVQDVDFIKNAAKRILEDKRLSTRAINSVTGRTRASRDILAVLETTAS